MLLGGGNIRTESLKMTRRFPGRQEAEAFQSVNHDGTEVEEPSLAWLEMWTGGDRGQRQIGSRLR